MLRTRPLVPILVFLAASCGASARADGPWVDTRELTDSTGRTWPEC